MLVVSPKRDTDLKSFVTGVLLRKHALRAFAKEGLKLSLSVLVAVVIIEVVSHLRGETSLRANNYDLLGGLLGIIASWIISAVRTISSPYRDFRSSNAKG